MDLMERLKLRTGETDEALLSDLLETAKYAILARRFPFGNYPVRAVPALNEHGEMMLDTNGNQIMDAETYVEDRYLDVQFRAALDLYNKMGAEGQTVHNENGITRHFEASWISTQIMSEVVPYCGVVT